MDKETGIPLDKMVKVRKIYDPYKQITYANVDDLLALLKDAKEHPEQYDQKAIIRLCEELMGKKHEPMVEKPF